MSYLFFFLIEFFFSFLKPLNKQINKQIKHQKLKDIGILRVKVLDEEEILERPDQAEVQYPNRDYGF